MADGGELLKTGWQEAQSRQKPTKFSMDGALREALNLAHPVNRDESWWAAKHAVESVIDGDMLIYNNSPTTTLSQAVAVYDAAIKAQGAINVTVSKAKGRK